MCAYLSISRSTWLAARAAPAEREAPRYVLSMRENLEFVLEQMRRVKQQQPSPAVLELLNRNARRPKKVRCLAFR